MDEQTERMNDRPMNDGVDLGLDDPLPDVPDAGDNSVPITAPDPIDFSTKGITAAGSVGMSTFNDADDRTFFERTVTAFEEEGVDSPMLGDTSDIAGTTGSLPRRRARIY